LAKKFHIRFVPGIEMTTFYEGFEYHILGYGFGFDGAGFQKKLDEIADYRNRAIVRMIEKIRMLHGFDLSINDVRGQAGKDYLGRPHIALALLRKGFINSLKDAFTVELIANPGRCYTPVSDLLPDTK